jgi:hypothetical protein
MKKLTFISYLRVLAFLSNVMADRKRSPLEWHGNAKRIACDGKLKDKARVANHPSLMVKPLEPVYLRMESPSSGGVGADEGNTFAMASVPGTGSRRSRSSSKAKTYREARGVMPSSFFIYSEAAGAA